jgi:hypothetical protein
MDKYVLCYVSWISIYVMLYLYVIDILALSCPYHACFLKIVWELLIYSIVALCIQMQILRVHTLWGSLLNIFYDNSCLNSSSYLCMTLARFVIVNQKGGDCKGILPLTIILVKNGTGAIVWANGFSKYIHMFSPHVGLQGGV